ncbi:hypothetical protein KEM54_002718 [Ascosphaera aggregata]|nr:hypothetical protein KEM54_002718 [Ascosphaera aggregata]
MASSQTDIGTGRHHTAWYIQSINDDDDGVGDSIATSTATANISSSPSRMSKQDHNSYSFEDGRTNIDKRSPSYILRSGLAGGLAGCAAKTIVGPLDRVKILFQTSNPSFKKYSTGWFGVVQAMRDINKADGIRGLFKGHSATLLRIFPYAAIKFLAYEQVRSVLIPTKQQETSYRRLLSGSLAGMTSVFFTYPLEMVRVRLAFETKHGVRSSLGRICGVIYRENPRGPSSAIAAPVSASAAVSSKDRRKLARSIAAATEEATSKQLSKGRITNFYRGFFPTIVGMFPYAGMSFLTHDTTGDWLRLPIVQEYTTVPETRPGYVSPSTSSSSSSSSSPPPPSHRHTHQRAQLTATAELFSGALSGLVAQTCSYPLEVIRRRMQVAGAVSNGRRMGIMETAKLIYAERRLRGFWVGLTIGYLKIVPMAAAGFYVYERGKWLFGI